MIREEIAEIGRLASQSAHNFTQDVCVTEGYDTISSRNYYTTRNGKVQIDWGWGNATVEIKTTVTGFWTFLTGTTRWKTIELTEDEQTLINGVYRMLEDCFNRNAADAKREAERAEKQQAEMAIVESEQTSLLRNALK